ncbi:MAG: cyclic nucleotide-binding domain-containing protein [Hyphomicrobiales bacterium]
MTSLRKHSPSPAFEKGLFAPVSEQLVRAQQPHQRHIRTLNDDEVRPKATIKPREIPKEQTHLDALFRTSSFEQHHQPESTILLHGDPANAVYQIVSGTVRLCTIKADGERQIFSFAKKGDYLGLSDIDTWHFTAEAIDHVILKSVPRLVLEQVLAVNITLRQEMRTLMRDLLVQREQQLFSLVYQKAPERLLGFLKDFSASRCSLGFVVLPMCRRDIADHLGMTTETVSRAFGDLKNRGIIEMATPEKFRLIH